MCDRDVVVADEGHLLVSRLAVEGKAEDDRALAHEGQGQTHARIEDGVGITDRWGQNG
jgi:hypothetical protein